MIILIGHESAACIKIGLLLLQVTYPTNQQRALSELCSPGISTIGEGNAAGLQSVLTTVVGWHSELLCWYAFRGGNRWWEVSIRHGTFSQRRAVGELHNMAHSAREPHCPDCGLLATEQVDELATNLLTPGCAPWAMGVAGSACPVLTPNQCCCVALAVILVIQLLFCVCSCPDERVTGTTNESLNIHGVQSGDSCLLLLAYLPHGLLHNVAFYNSVILTFGLPTDGAKPKLGPVACRMAVSRKKSLTYSSMTSIRRQQLSTQLVGTGDIITVYC